MTTYSVRMASGETFTWTGDPVSGRNWNTVAGFLILAGGTLINLAQIESMTPVGSVDAVSETEVTGLMAAKFVALAPRKDDQPRTPWTIGGRLIVDTQQAWTEAAIPHDGLVRVPADTLGYPVSMMSSPAAKHTPWWLIEDAAEATP